VEYKLSNLEKQIHALEGTYLQNTRNLGNILVGWDSYLSARSGALKRPSKFKESDRLFSLSSVSSFKSLGGEKEAEERSSEEDANGRPTKIQKVVKKQGPGRPRKNRTEDEEYVDV